MNAVHVVAAWWMADPLREAGLVYCAAIAVVILYTYLTSSTVRE